MIQYPFSKLMANLIVGLTLILVMSPWAQAQDLSVTYINATDGNYQP